MYKVLIVDDEPGISNGLKPLINWEEFGLEVFAVAENGAEALDALASAHLDIVITDIRMPIMDGIQLLEQIKLHYKHIKCIVLSGYDEFAYVKSAAMMGIENYFLKPVDVEQLSQTLLNTVKKIESDIYNQIKVAQDKTVLRNNLLVLLLTSNISPADFKEKAHVMELNIAADSYIVAIGRFDSRIPEDNPMRSIYMDATTIISEYLSTTSQGVSFCMTTGEIILLLTNRRTIVEGELVAFLNSCCEKVRAKTGNKFYVAVGTVETDIQNVCRSFAAARRILSSFIMLPGRYVITANDADRSITYPAEYGVDFASLGKLLEQQNLSGLMDWVDQLEHRIMDAQYPDKAGIHALFSSIILFLLAQAVIFNIDVEKLTVQQAELFSAFLQSFTLEDMMISINDIIKHYVSLMNEKKIINNIYVKKAITRIETDYKKQINLKVLASEMNITPAYLGQMFRVETGQTFTDYINGIRIERAKELLVMTTMKVNDIAEFVGFTNSTYFFAVFMKNKGMTPIKYRELNA